MIRDALRFAKIVLVVTAVLVALALIGVGMSK